MLSWVIQITIISFILIFLVHHLIFFFKSTLTVPKIKDLVNTSSQKYENMYNIIRNKPNTSSKEEYTLIDLLPTKPESSMKNELKNFLKKQMHETTGTPISSLDAISDNNSYSIYKAD
jgi:hypothetical protein